jgi:hypothetical protein
LSVLVLLLAAAGSLRYLRRLLLLCVSCTYLVLLGGCGWCGYPHLLLLQVRSKGVNTCV